MKIKPFELERYFAKYEFCTKYLLSSSDCEPILLKELLSMADNESLSMYENLSLGYTQSTGHPKLLEEIANLYNSAGEDNILVLAPQEGIFTASNVLIQKGDHVICTYPGYQSLYEIANSIGCEVSFWEARYSGHGAYFDLDELRAQVKENTKLIVFNFPHNPTGYVPPLKDYMEIFEIAREKGIYILSDEMYRYLETEGNKTLPFACDVYEKAVSLFGLSKTFALPGLRIGWLCSMDNKVMSECRQFRDYLTICSSAPSEIMAIMALRAKEGIIKRSREIVGTNLGHVRSFFERHNDRFSYYEPLAGSICYPKLEGSVKVNEFCEDLARKNEVMLLPCDVYGEDNNRFRLGYGRRNLPEALEALESYLKEN